MAYDPVSAGVGSFHIASPPTGGRCVRPSATGGARLLVKAASSTDLNLSATELIYGDEQVEHVSVDLLAGSGFAAVRERDD